MSTSTPTTNALRDLPTSTEWWFALASKYPWIDLHEELLKALDWYRVDRVKSPKLFFRNWVEKAARITPAPYLTAEEARARLRLDSSRVVRIEHSTSLR